MSNLYNNLILKDSTKSDFSGWVLAKQIRIEQCLDLTLPPEVAYPENLHQAMRYSALEGGKRIRALLCYAAAEFCGTDLIIADATACAVELIHAYSLVHDDMPCMDNDDLRRGKPSCHKKYGDATALLVGDALQSLAFECLSKPKLFKNESLQVIALNILAKAAGSKGMAGGQSIDLQSVDISLSQPELEAMHQLKTGALIHAAVLLGAVSESIDEITAINIFSTKIGLAFQVVDDILDVEADTYTLGKTAGKDAHNNKITYVTLLGIETAKLHANQLYQDAISAIQPFGHKSQRLQELAAFIMDRNF